MYTDGGISAVPLSQADSRRLVLFDIDGTLLTSSGAAPRAFRQALEEVFGTSGPQHGYSFAGRTDPRIARDLLGMAGLDPGTVDRGLAALWPLYLRNLQSELAVVPPTVYPGVTALLDRLEGETDQVVMGLLTGNVDGGARLKLEAAGLGWERFVVGAFGSDHHDRGALPAVAVERAAALRGHRFQGKAVVIIGDTPADIACGAHLGVRSLAVATGDYSVQELSPHNPDYVFENLADLDAVMKAVLE
ncbi:MAG: HAD family hydrolase [Gemmatimonadota bacterium]|jgi:phosphoglycolate phosphatase-like HAD superfamily hydrolase|nr:HAD family hydrolase [Gemmatimonadota bacterium]